MDHLADPPPAPPNCPAPRLQHTSDSTSLKQLIRPHPQPVRSAGMGQFKHMELSRLGAILRGRD
jgi:hypothetical protein